MFLKISFFKMLIIHVEWKDENENLIQMIKGFFANKKCQKDLHLNARNDNVIFALLCESFLSPKER